LVAFDVLSIEGEESRIDPPVRCVQIEMFPDFRSRRLTMVDV
jgi:hypothetical protein